MGLETHVFAWKEGNVVLDIADYFYPISILEKEKILKKCQQIDIQGILSIASDIAMPTVNYIAEKLNLVGNSTESTLNSTDKFEMRKTLAANGIPCPEFKLYQTANFDKKEKLEYPLIVKPTDRSGSRGVSKVVNSCQVNAAIKKALENSINKRVIVEEYINHSREFSVETISYKGNHYPLAITDKITTGPPHFVEIEHHQPAQINSFEKKAIYNLAQNCLQALGIENGASHIELVLDKNDNFKIIEIGGRMGGDFIGSHLVHLSTGFDFLKAVIEVSLDSFNINNYKNSFSGYAGVYFKFTPGGIVKDISIDKNLNPHCIEVLPLVKIGDKVDEVLDSSNKRAGILIYQHPKKRLDLEINAIFKIKVKDEK
ncbi:acetyl-CoA carboxylase biotin carboxylase subunit family protein [Mesonia sediminis]|uniref:Acetyl-CoA carboxylase biotin carboxylase subunit family protein n=1 Tax=Mesonia sediminis TaxID=1703946 RepID=A0ABW5SFZ6_9FLAO